MENIKTEIGYYQLLRDNGRVRRLWLAQVVSELGDWLNFVALLQLIQLFSGNAQAAGFLIAMQMLTMVVFSPIGGTFADRFDRRKVMIAADLIRALVVLGYLLIHQANQLWIIYFLAAVLSAFTAFFEPSRSALVPTLAEGQELILANALSGVTWSVMLAIGGAVGGIIAGLVSNTAAFLADSASFLLSASLLMRLYGNYQRAANEKNGISHSDVIDRSWWPVIRYLRERPRVLAVMLVKSGICLTAGSVWLLSVIYGQHIFPIGKGGAISVGLLYGAHGLGAVIGASLTSRFFRGNSLSPLQGILWAFILRSVCFVLWGIAPNLWLVALSVIMVTACGSLLWVMSTTLLQQLTHDEVRGRLFSLEITTMTLTMAISIFAIGHAIDVWRISPPNTTLITAAVAILTGIGWALVMACWQNWQSPDER
jgi:MFS family permease